MAYFVRQSNRSKGKYLQIYDSFWDPLTKKNKSRCVKTLGYICDLEEKGIEDPLSYYKSEVERINRKNKFEREQRKVAKLPDTVVQRMYGYFPLKWEMQRLEVKPILDLLQINRDFHFSVYELLSALVYARAVNPTSKYRTIHEVIPLLYGDYDFSYDQVLECLDFLGENYSKIIELFSIHVKETYGLDTDTSFFDCTNYYFEIDREDFFRRKGPSKENRKDPIVGMGLLLDRNCIPIGMRMYPGNESEKPVLRDIIKDLKREHIIVGKTIQVADKGLNCAKNLFAALENGDGYLFSQSVKKLPKIEKHWVLNDKDWVEVKDSSGKLKYKYKEVVDYFDYKDTSRQGKPIKKELLEKRVITFNPSLAKKQREEIEKMVDKALKQCDSQNKRSAYGNYAKYIDFKSIDESGDTLDLSAKAELNFSKISEDLRLCGYNMLITSEVNMSALELYETYHQLWRIEESFRTLKSEINARPVFLQKYERIIGHFLICYITLLLERLFQFKRLESKFSTSEISKFMKQLTVCPQFPLKKLLNVTPPSPLLGYMVENFYLPLDNLYLTKKDMEKVLRD